MLCKVLLAMLAVQLEDGQFQICHRLWECLDFFGCITMRLVFFHVNSKYLSYHWMACCEMWCRYQCRENDFTNSSLQTLSIKNDSRNAYVLI